jgi:acyl-CoA thioester hydrolase
MESLPPFRYLLRARFPECDAQGIVFNARYGDWTDLATTELLRALHPPFLASGPEAFEYRLVQQQTQWRRPARFDDVVEAVVEVARVGTSSFEVGTRFYRFPDRAAPLVEVVTVYVRVDPAADRSTPLRPLERALLSEGARGRYADHSGGAGGRLRRRVELGSVAPTPWRNGGGQTRELLREGEGAGGFALRISVAEVESSGPFSRFPGVSRAICLLGGAGLSLFRADGLALRLSVGDPVFCFSGEDDWQAELIEGPVTDLNVMTDRASLGAAVWRCPPGAVPGGLLFVVDSGTVGGEAVPACTLVELDGPSVCSAPSIAIQLSPGRA